ncbi:hypothetical protein [Muricoccus radiodurans]
MSQSLDVRTSRQALQGGLTGVPALRLYVLASSGMLVLSVGVVALLMG